MRVHVVFDEGPEWSDAIEGWVNPKSAKRRVAQLKGDRKQFLANVDAQRRDNPTLRMTNDESHARQSDYTIRTIEVKDSGRGGV